MADVLLLSELVEAVLAHIRRRVNNGEWTERGLAVRLGVSQPHLHNVLKGERSASVGLMDLLISRLSIDLLALCGVPRRGPDRATSPASAQSPSRDRTG